MDDGICEHRLTEELDVDSLGIALASRTLCPLLLLIQSMLEYKCQASANLNWKK